MNRKFNDILGWVLYDNQLKLSEISLPDTDVLELLYEQAERIPESELCDYAVGEETEVNRITSKYGVQDLSDWLESLII